MRLIKLGAASLNQTPLDWSGNKRNVLEAIREARERGVSVLVLPELCLSGYGCEDAFLSPGVQRTALEVLGEVVPHTKGIIVSLGLPVFFEKALFDCACLAADGEILGFAAKRFLAGDGLHYEPRWFQPWPQGRQEEFVFGNNRYPIGDMFFDFNEFRLGFEICEDAWAAARPGLKLAERGVDIILNPSASHFAFQKFEVRKRFVLEGSRAFGVSYVYANLLGNEAGRAIYDGCTLIASGGELLAAGPRFSYRDVVLTDAIVDLDKDRMSRSRVSGSSSSLGKEQDLSVKAEFSLPRQKPKPNSLEIPPWEKSANIKEEEFARSVSLGLFDYLRKSRSSGYVVSLSGGADSSAVSCLVSIMVKLGVSELGFDGFRDELSYVTWVSSIRDEKELLRELLICAYQATKNNSLGTRQAAESVAEALGATFLEFEIDTLVEEYTKMVSKGLGRELSWETDDVALQNIQARVRGPGVWFVANLRNALLLATSNRSEAAVGYSTMDGDTCGGLSPIAGIDKAYLRRWLQWLEVEGLMGLSPIPALSHVTSQAPSAELRPLEESQKDEQDLMPYEVLDVIERLAIRDKKMPKEILEILLGEFEQYERELLRLWIRRFFNLWCRNQWKRERYAPSFHLDDENLDPKTWCRFPILSGGFERELDEL